MTLILELTPDQSRRIELAKSRGIDVDALLIGVISSLPIGGTAPAADRTEEIFAQWEAEDAADDADEIARRQAEWETLQANMNANRAATGEEPLF
jgi:hypothetical protein